MISATEKLDWKTWQCTMADYKSKKAKSLPVTTAKKAKHDQRIENRIDLPITWKFKRMVIDENRRWNWRSHDDEMLLAKIFKKLAEFETMKYHEIAQSTGSHPIVISKFGKHVKKELDHLGIDDVPELFSLRLEGSLRVWCITSYNEFSLLWLDLDHEVYPCSKR